MLPTLRDINSSLLKQKVEHFPPDERAGFNYGKSICVMIESLAINEVDFLHGILKPLNSRLKRLTVYGGNNAKAENTASTPTVQKR